jgi:cation diffusion facilitator CzcD-associated flavoprotein CzcO
MRAMLPPEKPRGLAALEDAVRRDLELLDFPGRSWREPTQAKDGRSILDTLIVGGGQGGLSVAFGLLREKVTGLLVVDQNEAEHAGPWRTFARMLTLRTPKHLTGPDHNLPHLTVRAWYEAQHGEAAWQDLRFLPKEAWADYLAWYRKLLCIPVRTGTRVGALRWLPEERCFEAPIGAGTETVLARTVVLATGIDGSGTWQTPESVASLPRHFYAHTRDEIDFGALFGKRVGVLGAGASAFDNASVALEQGAAEVRLFFRRETLPNVNPYRWAEFVGFLKHHGDLPDRERWRFIHKIIRMGQLPPGDTFARATRFSGFHLHGGSPWQKSEVVGDAVRVHTPKGAYDFDFLLLGTGFLTDLSQRPELSHLHPDIALWRDRFVPGPGDTNEDLLRHPYLGSCFELQAKTPGSAPYLGAVFNYTFGCLLSLGFGGASISGMKYSLPKVVYGVTRRLFLEDSERYYQTLERYRETEFGE